jgi:hypothetical protein
MKEACNKGREQKDSVSSEKRVPICYMGRLCKVGLVNPGVHIAKEDCEGITGMWY